MNKQAIKKLSNNWQKCGVADGDILLIHSSIRRTIEETAFREGKLTPEDILFSFLDAVGPNGTILLPLFNFDFPKTCFFDIRNTPSQMGALTEAARIHKDSIRTGHPIYSFAAIGHKAKLFKGVDNESGYGDDSPFAILHKLNGKIAILDLEDSQSMTFYHYVEEMNNVRYRYFKNFSGTYINEDGSEQIKNYKLFVRDIEKNVVTHVNPAGVLMWKNGLYQGFREKTMIGLRTISSSKIFDFVTELIKSDKAEGNLFKIN